MDFIFYICISGLFFLYAWYAWVIYLLWKFFPKKHKNNPDYTPSVTVIVPTKNEEFTIEEKMLNLLELNYPRDKLEIIIVDSSSSDNTQEIVEWFKNKGIQLVVVPHKWKAFAMQEAINKYANWEILISTDANAYFKKDVIGKVVQHFYDPVVGWVSGAMMQIDESSTVESEWSWIYWKIEKFLRIHESKFHSCICMNGEITCVRRGIVKDQNWYFRWDPDDFDLSLFIVKKWYRIIYEPKAVVWEKAPDTADDIEKQKTRIIVQTISAFSHYFSTLFVSRYGFILFSHKFLALWSPLFLIGAFVSNIFLLENGIYLVLFIIQCVIYGAYFLKIEFSIFRTSNFLIFLNYLILKSYFMFLSGSDFTKWDKIMSSRK